MYKRELCKNWAETNFCRFGDKCQYAHGPEELSEDHHLYLQEQAKQPNDKYKSQNCRAFYREKLCMYGKRCHFRHEFRSFKKIHRHFYMCHLSALKYTHNDLLQECQNSTEMDIPCVADDNSTKICKVDSFNGSSTAESSDSSFDYERCSKESSMIASLCSSADSEYSSDSLQIMGQRPRLRAF